MAIEMDESVQRQLKNHLNIRIRRATSKPRWFVRAVLKRMPAIQNTMEVGNEIKYRDFQGYSDDLKNNGYAFIPNFLLQESYEYLIHNWPKTRWFAPMGIHEKSKTSDKGLWCSYGKPLFDITKNQALWLTYKMFLSQKFVNDVTLLAGDGIERTAYHLLSQQSYWGSGLAPHKDSKDDVHTSKINFIFFAEANGEGWDAGGTSIFKTNTFDSPVFIPKNLNNSCLFYYSDSELFHGFPPIKFGKHRKNIIAHFCAAL